MPKDLASLLWQTIDRELPHLEAVTDKNALLVPGETTPKAGDRWSRKEELGHLIDSAANNHIRFVLATTEKEFRGLPYAQNNWVAAHAYQELPWSMLLDFWYRYNVLLAHLIERIPNEHLDRRCIIASSDYSLRFVIEDYVLHMQHHIDHILYRDEITRYPGAAQRP